MTMMNSATEAPATATAALDFEHIGLTYQGGVEAVRDVTLAIEPGEFVSVVGPSGCGKSSLLSIAAGLQKPTVGTYERVSQPQFVFQEAALMPWRSVLQNVELMLELKGEARAVRREKAAAAIALVGLSGFESALPRQLSGGMKMRVSLARSLVCEPDVFLFDEPFGALDEITRERLQGELLRIRERSPFAGMFVTHSIAEACFLSDRVIVMTGRPGQIAAEFRVELDAPRDSELRFDEQFVELCHSVTRAMEG
ncbi:ABC transporter ATP-binding protein [Microbacterium sediminicola]|uniref:ABC transporter ATP-binding protein n=1 Tax=Microbacterium sediminicola TaxID=415210 RepID=A0ABN2II81_9MICO